MTVKWRVGDRDPRNNVDIALKKQDLRTCKTATDAVEQTTNVEERATGSWRSQDTIVTDSGRISHI